MKKFYLFAVLSGLVILLFSSPARAQENFYFQEDFEGSISPAWSLGPGWSVEMLDGNQVLRGKGHDWAVIDQQFPEAFHLQFRIRVKTGRLHLISHLTERGRYYIGLGGAPSALNKQYFPDQFLEDLAVTEISKLDSGWHEIEYISDGGILFLSIDGELQWEYQDMDLLSPGSIAFESLEGSEVMVDDIRVTGLGPEPPTRKEEGEEAGEQSPAEAGSWIRTGGPLGGLGYDVRMHPDNPDKMYVTDAFAGVFISKDGGKTWQPSNQGITDRTGESMDAIPVFCLTIDPNQPDIIWAGTQFSGGVFKSVDGGQSWDRKTQGITGQDGLTFRGISIEPGNSDVVYAAGEISSWAWFTEPVNGREFDLTRGVVYKSTDGGENWLEIWRGENLARYLLINPRNPEVLYLSTGIFDREAANSNPDTGEPGGEGVLKSVDGGKTWQPINNGLGNLYVGSLFMHPENPEILLAGTGNNQYFQNAGVYLTTNGGEKWEWVSSEYDINANAVEFASSDPQIAYAGGAGSILRSQDGGRTWITASGKDDGWGTEGVRGGFPIDFQVDPRDPERIFANNYGGGNFLSEDGGQTWQVASSGYTGAQVRSLALDPDQPGLVYAAARSGFFVSYDGGSTWEGRARSPYWELEWNAAAVDPSNPDHILAGNNWRSTILSSSDGAQTWNQVSAQPGENQGIRVFAFAPSDPRLVYAGTAAYYSAGVFAPEMPAEGIYVSRDGGQSWKQSTDNQYADAHIMDLAVAREDHEIAYAATSNYGVIRTLDAGESWEAVNQGLRMNQGASAVAIHPDNPDLVFAGIAFGGVYKSLDGGGSWQQISIGLNPEANISDLVIDPDNPDLLYTSDLFSGVYRSVDGGNTWQLFSENLRMRAVNQLALSSDSNHLYAATEGEGVYRLDLNGQPPPAARAPEPEADLREESQEVQEQEEESQQEPSETEAESDQLASDLDQEPETDPGRQVCPGSYLPLAVGMLLGSVRSARRKREVLPG